MPREFFFEPWRYDIIPEIAHEAVPREQQRQAYEDWAKNRSPESMNRLLRTFGKLINAEVGRYQGTLERPLLTSFAKKYVADAVRSYKPESGVQLSTHIVNALNRLHRLNYRNVQGMRLSEEIQQKINPYQEARQKIIEFKGREPTTEEIATEMKVDPRTAARVREQMKFEIGPSALEYSPQFTETSPEEEALDLLYKDLPDIHKKILEYKTGYGGAPIKPSKRIAKELGLSPVRVTQISQNIAGKLKKHLGHR